MAEVEDKESIARAHFPYRAEYCKTSRAKCKKCKEPMVAETLKLAIMTKSRFHDGHDANYYHVDCFFSIKRPDSVAEIAHFETLKHDDQKMLEEAIETKGKVIKVTVEGDSKKKKTTVINVGTEDFLVEYAKSSRSTCVTCDQKIEKGEVRLGKLDFNAETPWATGPIARWHHVDCFAKSLDQLEFTGEIDKLKDFDLLEDEDKEMLKKKIKVKKQKKDGDTKVSSKRMKTENADAKAETSDTKEDLALKKQSDRFFKLHKLVSSMKRKDVEEMLKSMDQKYSYKASTILMDMATDVLMFGPLDRCPECKQTGGMLLRGSSYICTSSKDETPCTYETRSPKRLTPFVPDEITEKYSFFTDGTYKFRPGQRIFPKKLVEAMAQREAEVNNTVQDGAPLDGLTIGVLSYKSLKNEKTKVQKKVTSLGGKLVTSLDSSCFVILASKDELEKSGNVKAEVAMELNVPICTDDFLFKIETKEQVVPSLKKAMINKWKGDLEERFTSMNENSSK